MRDMMADWKRWTNSERLVAIAIAAFIVLGAPTIAIVTAA